MPFDQQINEDELNTLHVDEDVELNARRGWHIIGASMSVLFLMFFVL